MRVEMTLSDAAILDGGYNKGDIIYTIKDAFTSEGLRFCGDDEKLAFEDVGGEQDYGHMWNVITSLLLSDWYIACATSCVYFDSGYEEDILSQAAEIRQMLS